MFFDAPSFDGDISTWKTGLVRDFTGTFSTGGIFNGDLSEWNVSSAKSMMDMFVSHDMRKLSPCFLSLLVGILLLLIVFLRLF